MGGQDGAGGDEGLARAECYKHGAGEPVAGTLAHNHQLNLLLQEGLLELQEARYRDLLLCVVTLGLGGRSRKLELPACLSKDEVS